MKVAWYVKIATIVGAITDMPFDLEAVIVVFKHYRMVNCRLLALCLNVL